MPAYVIAAYDIMDPKAFEPYVPGVLPLIAKHGGEVLAADFQAERLEGEPRTVNVILKFPSEEAARNWYNDPEYTVVKQFRINASQGGTLVLAKAAGSA